MTNVEIENLHYFFLTMIIISALSEVLSAKKHVIRSDNGNAHQ